MRSWPLPCTREAEGLSKSILTSRLAHNSTQVCAMRLSLVSKMTFPESRLDHSSQPIVVSEFAYVGNPRSEGPSRVSNGFRTSALAIVIIEWIDDAPGGSCQTHVVQLCLAGEGQRIWIGRGDCLYGTARGVRGSKRGVPDNRKPLFRGRASRLSLDLFGARTK